MDQEERIAVLVSGHPEVVRYIAPQRAGFDAADITVAAYDWLLEQDGELLIIYPTWAASRRDLPAPEGIEETTIQSRNRCTWRPPGAVAFANLPTADFLRMYAAYGARASAILVLAWNDKELADLGDWFAEVGATELYGDLGTVLDHRK